MAALELSQICARRIINNKTLVDETGFNSAYFSRLLHDCNFYAVRQFWHPSVYRKALRHALKWDYFKECHEKLWTLFFRTSVKNVDVVMATKYEDTRSLLSYTSLDDDDLMHFFEEGVKLAGNDALHHICSLDISYCTKLTDVSLKFILTRCPNLTYLNISGCLSMFSGPNIFNSAITIPNLKTLIAHDIFILRNANFCSLLDKCESLQSLDVSIQNHTFSLPLSDPEAIYNDHDCNPLADVLLCLKHPLNLKQLSIGGHRLHYATEERDIEDLDVLCRNFRNLETLDLSSGFRDVNSGEKIYVNKVLASLPNLIHLDITSCSLIDTHRNTDRQSGYSDSYNILLNSKLQSLGCYRVADENGWGFDYDDGNNLDSIIHRTINKNYSLTDMLEKYVHRTGVMSNILHMFLRIDQRSVVPLHSLRHSESGCRFLATYADYIIYSDSILHTSNTEKLQETIRNLIALIVPYRDDISTEKTIHPVPDWYRLCMLLMQRYISVACPNGANKSTTIINFFLANLFYDINFRRLRHDYDYTQLLDRLRNVDKIDEEKFLQDLCECLEFMNRTGCGLDMQNPSRHSDMARTHSYRSRLPLHAVGLAYAARMQNDLNKVGCTILLDGSYIRNSAMFLYYVQCHINCGMDNEREGRHEHLLWNTCNTKCYNSDYMFAHAVLNFITENTDKITDQCHWIVHPRSPLSIYVFRGYGIFGTSDGVETSLFDCLFAAIVSCNQRKYYMQLLNCMLCICYEGNHQPYNDYIHSRVTTKCYHTFCRLFNRILVEHGNSRLIRVVNWLFMDNKYAYWLLSEATGTDDINRKYLNCSYDDLLTRWEFYRLVIRSPDVRLYITSLQDTTQRCTMDQNSSFYCKMYLDLGSRQPNTVCILDHALLLINMLLVRIAIQYGSMDDYQKKIMSIIRTTKIDEWQKTDNFKSENLWELLHHRYHGSCFIEELQSYRGIQNESSGNFINYVINCMEIETNKKGLAENSDSDIFNSDSDIFATDGEDENNE